ncbi:GLUT8 [Mytilus edulis]|uniref:SLC2A8 n=1 Tax=Mytilus edulis TaxID=6550 RepID=A0A8S3R1K2_MYTED|nr:GLUT8 [Mytilus edulis]
MTVTCFTFGAYYFAIKAGRSPETLSWLAVGSLIIYIIGFSLGWGPIPLLAMSELFPARARGAASGMRLFVNWLCAFIVTKQFLLVQDWFGEAVTFWIFGAFCLGGVMFVIKYLPETKGKSLEDIELYFLDEVLHILVCKKETTIETIINNINKGCIYILYSEIGYCSKW